MAIDFTAGLRHKNATPAPVVQMTAEAMKAGHATAQHPAMRPAMEVATNKPQPVGTEDPDSKRTVIQPTDNPATNQALATAEMPAFESRLQKAIAGIQGAQVVATRDYKKPDRLGEKINQEAQPAETIADYGAAQVSVDSPKAKDAVVAAVRKEFPVVKAKDLFDKGDDAYHFHHISLQVQMPSHATIELQIVPKEVMDANPDQHHDYKAAREAKIQGNAKAEAWAAAQGRRKNDAAMAKFTARNKAEGDGEHKYKFGNTQANVDPASEAHQAIKRAQDTIPPEHLAGDGKDIDDPHVTLKYGIQGGDTSGIKAYLAKQKPFDATLKKTSSFPPSEHSDGAAVIKADVHAPELHRMNAEIGSHGDFAPASFNDYKPHVTVAYVKPEHAQTHIGNHMTEGKKFRVSSVHISDRDGNKQEVRLQGSSTNAGNSEVKGDRGKSPEQTAGAAQASPAAITKGSSIVHHDGTAGTVQWAMGAKVRMKTLDGARRDVNLKETTPIPDVEKTKGGWIGVDLDKTMATKQGPEGPSTIGAPIPAMIDRVKKMLAQGKDVRIFTARISGPNKEAERKAINAFAEQNFGRKLPITDKKDDHMLEMYDDRARQVEPNTGQIVGEKPDFRAGLKPKAKQS